MRLARMLAVLAVVAVLLGACGNDGGGTGSDAFTVVGTEMAFEAPESVDAGSYDVTFHNAGAVAHELAFRSPDGQFVTRRSIGAGQRATIEVALVSPGTWELGCFEPGHYEAGMHKPLRVV